MVSKSISMGLVEYEFLANDIGIDISEKQDYNGFTMAINGISTQEVDEIFLRMVSLGGEAIQNPIWKDWAGNLGYSGYIKDLDGYIWEIAYAPFLELNQNGAIIV